MLRNTIKEILTIEEVLKFYGFTPNRSGFIVCPFHSEKTASLKVNRSGKSFKCYGCGAAGTIIDFVMKLFNISFEQACVRLNADFNLGLTNVKPDIRKVTQRKERFRKELDAKKKHKEEVGYYTDLYKRAHYALINKAPKSPDDPVDEEYIWALHQIDYLNYYFEMEGVENEQQE